MTTLPSNIIGWKERIKESKGFDEIRNIFADVFLISLSSFRKYEAKKDAQRAVEEALRELDSGIESIERKCDVLQKLDNDIAFADLPANEYAAIMDKYKPTKNLGGMIMDTYFEKGNAVLDIIGIADVAPKIIALSSQITDLEEKVRIKTAEIHAVYMDKREAAREMHLYPLHKERTVIEDEIHRRLRELADQKPKREPDNSPEQETARMNRWQESVDKVNAEHDDPEGPYNKIRKEIVTAYETYINPIIDEENAAIAQATKELGLTEALETRKTLAKDVHDKLIGHLLDNSPVTSENAESWFTQNSIMNKTAVMKAKKAGYDPAEVKKDVMTFYRITGGRLPTLEYVTTRNTRSMASPSQGKVYVGSSFGKRTLFHELAHLLEADKKVTGSAYAFLNKRRESDTKFSLKSLTGNFGYRSDEIAYKDTWFDPYVGKYYRHDTTEVYSMGMQMLSSPELLLSLHEKDPEHLSMMLGLCASTPAIDEKRKEQAQKEIQAKKENIIQSEAFIKSLDKKVATAGESFKKDITIEPNYAYAGWGKQKLKGYYIYLHNENDNSGWKESYYFKNEKNMNRAIYLWNLKGRPSSNSSFSLGALSSSFNYNKGRSFPEDVMRAVQISESQAKEG
jgi:hypothetical protein